MDQEIMQVRVSGKSVYEAVKNYLQNNEYLKAQIAAEVDSLVKGGFVKAQVERHVADEMRGYYLRDAIKDAAKTIVDAEVKKAIEAQVTSQVNKLLSGAIIMRAPNNG